jgi:hypothetical protein
VSIKRPIKQEPWGKWKDVGGWLYGSSGVMTIDIEEASNG